jgi:hypothetical protein
LDVELDLDGVAEQGGVRLEAGVHRAAGERLGL